MKSTKYSKHKSNAMKLAGLVFSNFVALSYSSQSFSQLLDPSPLRDPASAQIDQTPMAPMAVHPMSGLVPQDNPRTGLFTHTQVYSYSYQMIGSSTTKIRYGHQGASKAQVGRPEDRTEIQQPVRQDVSAPVTATDGSPLVAERQQGTETPRTETPRTETPRTETPRAETPRTETPRAETPRTETPRTEIPTIETPRAETSRAETPRTETPRTEIPTIETPRIAEPAQDAAAPKPADEVSALAITAELKKLVPNNSLIQAAEEGTIIPQLRNAVGEIETVRLRGQDKKLNGRFSAMVRFVERELDASGARRQCRIRVRGTFVKSTDGSKTLTVNIEKADKPEYCYGEKGKDMYLISSKDGSRFPESEAIRLLTRRRGQDKPKATSVIQPSSEVKLETALPTRPAPPSRVAVVAPLRPASDAPARPAADAPAPAAGETRLSSPRPLPTGIR